MDRAGLNLGDQSAFFRLHPGDGLLLLGRFHEVPLLGRFLGDLDGLLQEGGGEGWGGRGKRG